ncbi:MAG TPA: glycogen debranching N-terminal domain-containing protein [Chloroflexota bacterium]|nr:glycogen debranching N-terminal domain-containing protein [Chloroflexota bacterium]
MAQKTSTTNQPQPVIQYKSPIGAQDIRDTIVIKEQDLFLITNLDGNVPQGNVNGLGLYYHDTRYLSTYELVLEGITPIYLLSTGRERFSLVQELTNPDLLTQSGQHVPRQVIRIQRQRVIGPDLWEEITLANFHIIPLQLRLSFAFGADFVDMFAVRGLVDHARGKLYAPRWSGGNTLIFSYDGLDGVTRTTTITFDPPPTSTSAERAEYCLAIPARGQAPKIRLEVSVSPGPSSPVAATDVPALVSSRSEKYQQWLSGQVGISSDNPAWDDTVHRARFDLRLLTSRIDGANYPAAGVPWYVALFGRDSLVTALQTAWFPTTSAEVLRVLAKRQGTTVDDWKDEQPGKVLHELRQGELASAKVIPYSPYFGSVDATILFVILLDRYYQITGDVALLQELAGSLKDALAWMERYGDLDGDGFIEYKTRSPAGLRNQGWKDSWDAIMNADGSLVEPPVALVEVQGYAYAARRAAAEIYRALHNPEDAARFDYQADWLRDHFNAAFWMDDEECYCLGLDKDKRQAKVVSSNAGQALWSGIAPAARAQKVAERLMQPDMFSGWGIRTLATKEVRYNPMGYHVGTVWPHDNSLIALGFKRYGQDDKVLQLLSGLYDVALRLPDGRLPELFCGYPRTGDEDPVRYPVACSPQAWAAGVFDFLVQITLGIRPDAPGGVLRLVRPRLPDWLRQLTVHRIPVGPHSVDLSCRREGDHTYTEIVNVRGNVQVTFTEEWGD